MKSQTGIYWLAQFIGWFSYSMIIFLVLYIDNKLTRNGIILLFLFSALGILFSHGMRWVFRRFDFFRFKLNPLIPRLLLVALVSSVLFQGTYALLSLVISRPKAPDSILEIIVEILLIMFLFLIWILFYFSYHYVRKSRLEEIKNLQLADSQKEIELQNLRTQLNPHFLFNALNSIRALIDLEPKLAKDSVTKLSNILRTSLLFGRKELITLEEECNFVRDYLDLEKVRFEERLQVEWMINTQLLGETIPPLILQTLVENAIKHGISNLKAGGIIEISAENTGRELVLTVRNSGTIQNKVDVGVGIQNTKRRLALTYGDKADFTLREAENMVVAEIRLKKET